MKKKIYGYYIENDFNCAETTIRAANDLYDLKMTEEEMKLVSGFGGGMGCGFLCGCLAADISIISKLFVKKRAHESDRIKTLCGLFVSEFQKEFSDINCSVLKPANTCPETRCLKLIESNFDLLEKFIKENLCSNDTNGSTDSNESNGSSESSGSNESNGSN